MFWRTTCLFALLQFNLCDNFKTNLSGSFFLLFSVFMNIVSILIFENNCSISFSILFSAKNSLLFIINSISCFKLLSTSLGQSKWKWKVLESLITIIFPSIIIMAFLNCCKLFWWFYYADTKDIEFFWFHGSLVYDLFGVMIFNRFHSFISSSTHPSDS